MASKAEHDRFYEAHGKNRFHMFQRTWKQPSGYLELFYVHICLVQMRLVASFGSLSNMSCTLVSCDILNVCGSIFTKIRLYKEFQYNTDSAERFRNTTLISNSQQSVNFVISCGEFFYCKSYSFDKKRYVNCLDSRRKAMINSGDKLQHGSRQPWVAVRRSADKRLVADLKVPLKVHFMRL